MKQLAIIGAGQLGSRHLQGLARLAIQCDITVVDPMPASLDVARQRFEEMPPNPAIQSVRYVVSIDDLPQHLDYVIVATTANVRMQVLRGLLAAHCVRFLLLEKVLFQHVAEYAEAQALLEAAGVRVWVNCPRRSFAIYQELHEFFAGDRLRALSAVGGNWGLGCNSIHFIDLFALLSGGRPESLSGDGLDAQLIPSKRKDFMEFTGSLRGSIGGAQFDITSLSGSTAKLIVTIRGDQRTCVVDEGGGKAFLFDGTAWQEKNFRTPFLSELGAEIASDILTRGDCSLTSYAESQAYHLPLVRCLAAHAAAGSGGDGDYCPVT
jgi:predicted dehydrogenase